MYNNLLTAWQKVIFRNYGTVKNSLIGQIIGLEESAVVYHAEKLGLDKIVYEPSWQKDGFVTIIRNNWDLLSKNDIATLLEIPINEFNKLLVEYDFLDVKLGVQPQINKIVYSPLSSEDEQNTEKVRKIVKDNFKQRKVKPFDFFNNFVKPYYKSGENKVIKDRFLSSYCAKYSGTLLDDNLSDYSDEYLKMLSSTGTNGIWLSDTLRNLADFPFDQSFSPDYKIRVNNLRKLTERCAKYGIKVYLYINEPRSLPESFFDTYPDLKGQKADDGTYCMCTSKKEVQDYLYGAIKSLAQNVPLLYAVMTITMSENPTHCYSRPWVGFDKIDTNCPNCLKRKPQEIVSEINNIISRALKDGNGHTKLISNVWGWANFAKDIGDVFECIDKLDKEVDVLCVSEYGKKFVLGGVNGVVDDYSISIVGPSDFAKKVLSYAKERGHKIWAKIQINNSWECSATPYLPVFGLMAKHLENLKVLGLDGLMLGWSLGGYPGGILPLINSLCENDGYSQKEWYKQVYGDCSGKIEGAVKIFDNAFTNYPFSVNGIYYGAHNMGPGNLWSLECQNRGSTMVCFTFDDFKMWTAPYGIETYISLLSTLCKEWKKGLDQLGDVNKNLAAKEFVYAAKASYVHFNSALNLAIFSKLKSDATNNLKELTRVIDKELELTNELYELVTKDAKIGFEMTNHYYYNENLLLEKLINLNEIKSRLNNV